MPSTVNRNVNQRPAARQGVPRSGGAPAYNAILDRLRGGDRIGIPTPVPSQPPSAQPQAPAPPVYRTPAQQPYQPPLGRVGIEPWLPGRAPTNPTLPVTQPQQPVYRWQPIPLWPNNTLPGVVPLPMPVGRPRQVLTPFQQFMQDWLSRLPTGRLYASAPSYSVADLIQQAIQRRLGG